MTLGETLKMHRTNQGLSQEKVAELIGVSRQAVTKWENNQSTPSSDNLIALSKIYDVSLDELIENKHHAQQKQVDQSDDKKILHANLTRIAIITQLAFLSVVMEPFLDTADPALNILEMQFKIVPLLAASIWMAYNLRYEKDKAQYKKNTKIELVYCLVQTAVMLFGYYSAQYFISRIALLLVALFYIFYINPKYMNRQLVKETVKKTSQQ